jgi:ketosteroid isomerase-like protein
VSQDEVEVVRAMFGAWETGDVDAMLDHVAAEVDWSPSLWSGAGVSFHGHDGVREWAAQFEGPERRIEVRASEYRDGPAGVVVIADVTEFRGASRGPAVTVGWVFEVAGGKVRRGEGFSDPEHALRIAGIWE